MFDGWTNHACPLDEPSHSFGALAGFVDLWRSKHREGALPAWRQFDLMDFRGWWGWICVLDAIEDEPHAFRVRLWGTEISDVLGVDVTGSLLNPGIVSRLEDKRQIDDEDLIFYREIIENRQIGRSAGPAMDVHRNGGWYEEVIVPLADDGMTIDKLMFCGRFEAERRQPLVAVR